MLDNAGSSRRADDSATRCKFAALRKTGRVAVLGGLAHAKLGRAATDVKKCLRSIKNHYFAQSPLSRISVEEISTTGPSNRHHAGDFWNGKSLAFDADNRAARYFTAAFDPAALRCSSGREVTPIGTFSKIHSQRSHL